MEMELMENGLPVEEQTMQPDAVPEMEPGSGPDVPEPVEAETPEEPPKRKRAARKKTGKAADDSDPAPGDTLEGSEDLPAPENGSLEDSPLGEGLSEADQLDPETGTAAEGIVVMGLAEQDVGDAPAEEQEPVEAAGPPPSQPDVPEPERTRPTAPRARPTRSANNHSRLLSLDLNRLDRDLTEPERQEWNNIYASFRSKSVLTGKIIGIEAHAFNVQNRETGQVERRRIYCAAVIAYKVKVLIPETEMWMPGEERPTHVLRNMSGAEIDYVILDVDRVGGMATASRRMGAVIRRHAFDTARGGHEPGERLPCRILTVGPNRCLVECGGRDLTLRYRDISYSSYDDLRKQYRPGEHHDCILKEYDRASGLMRVSIKEAAPNPFEGAIVRHPLGCRRQAVISGKYGGGVFCTMTDGTTCLCLYTAQHTDRDFRKGDTVILAVVKYDYDRSLIYGRILSKW